MRILTILLIAAAMPALAAEDPVYKWVDDKGVVHYTDKPPSKNAKPAKLPPLQTFSGEVPDLSRFTEPAPAPGPAPVKVQIVQPGPEETLRDGTRSVTVAVVVSPGLDRGQLLQYYLDGQPRGDPTAATSFVVDGVERGSHTIAAAVMQDGRELGRSAVTIHMKPPVAR